MSIDQVSELAGVFSLVLTGTGSWLPGIAPGIGGFGMEESRFSEVSKTGSEFFTGLGGGLLVVLIGKMGSGLKSKLGVYLD